MSSKKPISLDEKKQIVDAIESGETQAALGRRLGLSKSTVNTIYKNKRKILSAIENGEFTSKQKRMRTAAHPQLEEALDKWLRQEREQNILVTGPLLKAKAAIFCFQFNLDDFVISDGWLQRFRKRKGIVFKNVKGTYQVDNEEGEAEMDLSDEAETEQSGKEDEPSSKRMKCDESSNNFVDANERLVLSSKVYMVKEENDSLKCQLDAYKNELDLVKMENMNEVDAKEGQIKMLQQTLQGVQQQLLKFKKDEIKRQQTEDEPSSAGKAMATLTGDNLTNGKDELKANKKSLDVDVAKDDTEQISSTHQASKISNRQARLIGLISTFLHVHPFGASIDYIWSYLQQIDPALLPSDVENLMLKFPNVFKQRFSGIGVRIERKWIFEGFNDTPT